MLDPRGDCVVLPQQGVLQGNYELIIVGPGYRPDCSHHSGCASPPSIVESSVFPLDSNGDLTFCDGKKQIFTLINF